MSIAALKEICDERGIRRLALVDDVFDAPAPQRLERAQYAEFREKYNTDGVLQNAVAWVSGRKTGTLPGFEDLDEDEVNPLWVAVWKPRLGGRRLREEHRRALHSLFEGHGDDVLGMLDEAARLVSFFRDDLGRKVSLYGTDFDAADIAGAQVVMVDYFLGQGLTAQEALEKAVGVVVAVVDAARKAKTAVPSFLLISDRPDAVNDTVLRERAELMKSRFRLFGKRALYSEDVDQRMNLYDLIDASDRTERVERLIEDWRCGARRAIESVRAQMLGLDVSDLVYLDCFRLTYEGRAVGSYLRWFFTALLSARVAGELTKGLWREADCLRLSRGVDESDDLNPRTLMNTFDGPSGAIGEAYGDILFDETRGGDDTAFPGRLGAGDLVEGDLFVRPKGRDRKGYHGAEVRLVMTPSCDLMRRAGDAVPAARSVLLLPGVLKYARQENEQSDLTRVDFVRVHERGVARLLEIRWNFRHPISVEWQSMSKEGPGSAYRRMGRLRELHFHKVRDRFAGRLTNIGTEVVPLFPRARGGQVFMANGTRRGKGFVVVMSFESAEGFLWEFGPVPLTRGSGRAKKGHVYQVSRPFIAKLRGILESLPEREPTLAAACGVCAAALENMQTYMELLRPMEAGRRGRDHVIEVKKGGRPENAEIKSASDIVIVPFEE